MLNRQKQPIPEEVKQALLDNILMDAYLGRPEYQQNDYISWISRAKLESTRAKRLNQMLFELEKGGIYMKMDHPASRK